MTATTETHRSNRPSLRKYLTIFRYATRDQLIYLPAFMIRNIFFVLIIFIFYSLWKVVYGEREFLAGLTIVQALWYLTFTETVELGKARSFEQIQQEVKDGTIAYSLIRPYSYILYYLVKGTGEGMVRMVPMLTIGFVVAWLFTGPLPGYLSALPAGVLLIMGGYVLTSLWQILIGLLAFWFEEVGPFYWILQKLVFILGGMFFPIDFFPDWLQGVSKSLPFAYSAYWPAITIVNYSPGVFVHAMIGQVVYIILLGSVCLLVFRSGRRKIHAQGG